MSWDATLIGATEQSVVGFWNYTHNTNGMIWHALGEYDQAAVVQTTLDWYEAAGHHGFADRLRVRTNWYGAWWRHLNAMGGPEGANFLHRIIRALENDPVMFRAMNPENGWGDYDSLLDTLRDMRNAVPEWVTYWEVHG